MSLGVCRLEFTFQFFGYVLMWAFVPFQLSVLSILVCMNLCICYFSSFRRQGILLPAKFDEFSSKQEIIISMAASVRDVCKRNPDRGVDLVLSVEVWLQSILSMLACSFHLIFEISNVS